MYYEYVNIYAITCIYISRLYIYAFIHTKTSIYDIHTHAWDSECVFAVYIMYKYIACVYNTNETLLYINEIILLIIYVSEFIVYCTNYCLGLNIINIF